MTDATNEFLEALRGRLQSLELAGVTLIPRLLSAAMPMAAPAAAGAAASGGASDAAQPATGDTAGGSHSWADVARQLKSHVEKKGLRNGAGKPLAPAAAAPAKSPPPRAAASPARQTPSESTPPPAPAAPAKAKTEGSGDDPSLRPSRSLNPTTEKELADLAATVAKCTRCKELARSRTQTVFCSGAGNADLMFVGEAPGEDEDRQGEAFVGRAGQLLTKIITGGMHMRRQDVYICNILKCRPPGNRNPLPDEAARCREYLDRQIELVAPKVICLLGGVASKFLLDDMTPVGRMRGRWFDYRGIPVRVTYHPAYLLRNYTADARQKVWDDVLEVVKKLKSLRDTPGGPKQAPPTMF